MQCPVNTAWTFEPVERSKRCRERLRRLNGHGFSRRRVDRVENADIALLEPISPLRRDLCAALEHVGHRVIEIDRLVDLVALEVAHAVCFVADRGLAELVQVVDGNSNKRVVVLRDPDSELTSSAYLALGAASVLPREASGEAVALAVHAAALGYTVLPTTEIMQDLPKLEAEKILAISELERALLADLAAGRTVMEIASAHSYSERDLYRRLAKLYRRLGVGGRHEATLLASRLGLIRADAIHAPRVGDNDNAPVAPRR